MPTFPLSNIDTRSMLFESAITNALVLPAPLPVSENCADGDEVPMPSIPELRSIHIRGEEEPTEKRAEVVAWLFTVNPEGVEEPTYSAPANDEVAVVDVEIRVKSVVVP